MGAGVHAAGDGHPRGDAARGVAAGRARRARRRRAAGAARAVRAAGGRAPGAAAAGRAAGAPAQPVPRARHHGAGPRGRARQLPRTILCG